MICIEDIIRVVWNLEGSAISGVIPELINIKNLMKQASNTLKFGRNNIIKEEVIRNLDFYSK